jgi:hypothetical protein
MDKSIIENAHEYFSKQASCYPADSSSRAFINDAWKSYCGMIGVEPPALIEDPTIARTVDFVKRFFNDDRNAISELGDSILTENLQVIGQAIGISIDTAEFDKSGNGKITLFIDKDSTRPRILEHKLRQLFTALCKGLNTELLESVKIIESRSDIMDTRIEFTPACEAGDLVMANARDIAESIIEQKIKPLDRTINFVHPAAPSKQKQSPVFPHKSEPEDIINAVLLGARLPQPAEIQHDQMHNLIVITLPENSTHNYKRVKAALAALASAGLAFTPLNEQGDLIALRLQNTINVLAETTPEKVMDAARASLQEQVDLPLYQPKSNISRRSL